MSIKVTDEMQELVGTELRCGTSKSRIASLLDLPYDEAVEVINTVKESVRPDIGDEIRFTFRERNMVGRIEKLLTNSAVVKIYWDYSDEEMREICESKTIVNFKDIDEYVKVPSS